MAVDLDQGRLDDLVGSLDGSGHVGAVADLRGLSTHGALVERASLELGNVYVLANLAAVLRRRGSLDEVTEDDWDFQHDINVKSAFFLARATGSAMIAAGKGGRIILFSSQGWGTGGFRGSVACSSAKGRGTPRWPAVGRAFRPHPMTLDRLSPGQAHTRMPMPRSAA